MPILWALRTPELDSPAPRYPCSIMVFSFLFSSFVGGVARWPSLNPYGLYTLRRYMGAKSIVSLLTVKCFFRGVLRRIEL